MKDDEPVHLVHRDHGPAFWSKLGSLMPYYDERKELLGRLGYVW